MDDEGAGAGYTTEARCGGRLAIANGGFRACLESPSDAFGSHSREQLTGSILDQATLPATVSAQASRAIHAPMLPAATHHVPALGRPSFD